MAVGWERCTIALNTRCYCVHRDPPLIVPVSKGKYDEADPLYRRALASDEKTLGRDHPTVAKDLNNLGVSMTKQARSCTRAWCFPRLAVWTRTCITIEPQLWFVHGTLQNAG